MILKNYVCLNMLLDVRPRGPMDKASDFESEDWGFESLRGQLFYKFKLKYTEEVLNFL